MDLKKAQDAKRIAAKLAELSRLRGVDGAANFELWEKYLPGRAEGRTSGWSTQEVLDAIEAAMREPVA